MKAAILRDVGSLSVEEIDIPEPGPHEIRVKLSASGICHTDMTAIAGLIPQPRPAVAGHEGVGIVDAVGADVSNLAVGANVVLNYASYCGLCRQCQRGRYQLCETYSQQVLEGLLLDGTTRLTKGAERLYHFHRLSTFAEYAVVPAMNAVMVSGEIDVSEVAALGCGAITGYGAVIRRLAVEPGSSVLVIGVGGVGLGAVMTAQLVGAQTVIAVDRSERALALAAELGASHTIKSDQFDEISELVREIVPTGVRYSIDTTGAPGAIEAAIIAAADGGEIVALGMTDPSYAVQVPIMSLIFERRLTGSAGGSIRPQIDIPRAAELFAHGRFPVDRLITRRYAIDDVNTAFDDMHAGLGGRGVLQFST